MQNNGRLPGYWLCFSPDTPQEKAAARFREKYGYTPREVILQRGLLWVGPVGEPETQPASPSVIRRRIRIPVSKGGKDGPDSRSVGRRLR
jgi:hypothetical protein